MPSLSVAASTLSLAALAASSTACLAFAFSGLVKFLAASIDALAAVAASSIALLASAF